MIKHMKYINLTHSKNLSKSFVSARFEGEMIGLMTSRMLQLLCNMNRSYPAIALKHSCYPSSPYFTNKLQLRISPPSPSLRWACNLASKNPPSQAHRLSRPSAHPAMEQKPVHCSCPKRFKNLAALHQHQRDSPLHPEITVPPRQNQAPGKAATRSPHLEIEDLLQRLSLQTQEADYGVRGFHSPSIGRDV